jgi:hypothetical protein
MLADHVDVGALSVHAEQLRQALPESGRVEHGPGAEDQVPRASGGVLREPSHDVDRVAHDQHHCTRRDCVESFDHCSDQIAVVFLEPRLARLQKGTDRDDHDLCSAQLHPVVGRDNFDVAQERGAIGDVPGFALGASELPVVKHDSVGRLHQHERVRDRCADVARAHDRDAARSLAR